MSAPSRSSTKRLVPLVIDPDRDPWEQQPGETDTQYGWFRAHLEAGLGRTVGATADTVNKNPSYLREIAGLRLWRQRVTAYDTHRAQVREQVWLEKCGEAAEADAKILTAAAGKIAQRLMSLNTASLSDGDFVRLLDVVMRHRRQLMGPVAELNVNATVTTRTQLDQDVLDLLEQMESLPSPGQEEGR
ncbi:hypothetical protein ACFVWN_01005 [Nocardiopsis flavescens]|uniref:hypothetical protein n=1 Tax=Nocardiopsis flavescens TaxID=758803 RepID=UPI00365A2BF9